MPGSLFTRVRAVEASQIPAPVRPPMQPTPGESAAVSAPGSRGLLRGRRGWGASVVVAGPEGRPGERAAVALA
eukprot:5277283-Lingulodinium_polyedra.AAC.1